MYFDFTNVFYLLALVTVFFFALITENGGLRIGAHIILIVTFFNLFEPIFSAIYLGFASLHIMSGKRAEFGRLTYVLLACALLLTVSSGVVESSNHNVGNNSGGIPQRVALVEEVLLVKEVLEVSNQSAIDVTGTDYLPFDDGKLQVYLSVGDFPISTATCFVSALYPNMTYFIENQLMIHANNTYFEGLYYYDFTVPNVTGVYPVNAICQYDTNSIFDYVTSISFDGLATSVGSVLDDLKLDDDIKYGVKDFSACNGINCSANFTIQLPTGWRTGQISVARLMLEVVQTKDKTVVWFVDSPSSNQTFLWFTMTTKNINYIQQFDVNSTFANDTNITVRAVAFDFQGSQMDLDYLFHTRAYAGTTVNDLRGNEELVVSKGLVNISDTAQLILNNNIQVIEPGQFGQILLIIIMVVLLLIGYFLPLGLLMLMYSFIYLDGLLTLIGAVLGAVTIYFGKVREEKK